MTVEDKKELIETLNGLMLKDPANDKAKGFNNGIKTAIDVIEQSWDSDKMEELMFKAYHNGKKVYKGRDPKDEQHPC